MSHRSSGLFSLSRRDAQRSLRRNNAPRRSMSFSVVNDLTVAYRSFHFSFRHQAAKIVFKSPSTVCDDAVEEIYVLRQEIKAGALSELLSVDLSASSENR